jgi:hypothetical protein
MHPVGRSSGRPAWAAIVGLAIGAALLAGLDEPERAASATRPRGAGLAAPKDARALIARPTPAQPPPNVLHVRPPRAALPD